MPARRELHTGRYNFLHRSWGPIEPYDDSMPEILKNHGIHSHLVSDHSHYWEDGGANYHTRYSTWENIRGQEGDPYRADLNPRADASPNLVHFTGMRGRLYHQDLVNRSYIHSRDDFPQTKTVSAGVEFIDTNHNCDNWFLQVECFDPHEPFFSSEEFQKLYPKVYDGGRFDWPDYAALTETPQQAGEARRNYMALLSMCDWSLGRILDKLDEYNLWEDTLLIVNTDHGYMLGEHNFWAKNYMPFYQELVHLPLFIWDPVSKKCDRSTDIKSRENPETPSSRPSIFPLQYWITLLCQNQKICPAAPYWPTCVKTGPYAKPPCSASTAATYAAPTAATYL